MIHKTQIHKRDLRAARFLDAALQIVGAEGVDALTVQRLAKELGYSAGALYRTFPSKEDLVAALQVRALDALSAAMSPASPRRSTAPLGHLIDVLSPFVELQVSDPVSHRLLDDVLSSPQMLFTEERAKEIEEHLAPILHAVEAALSAAVKEGALDPGDAGTRARVLWATLHGVDHLRKRDRLEKKSRTSTAVRREALRALLVGFGADKEEAERAVKRM